jgi:hypothetical protein
MFKESRKTLCEGVAMKTWSTMAAVLVMALVASVALAAEGDKKPNKKPMAKRVAGEITAIDTAASPKTITIKPKEGEAVVVNLAEKVKVRIDGKESTLDAVKAGTKGVVTYDAEGKNGVSINIGGMKGHGEGRK